MSTIRDRHDREIQSPINRTPNEEKDLLTRADFIERLLIETANIKSKRRNSHASNGTHRSEHIDKLLQDENNDWFFEKILEKFDDLRSKRTLPHSSSYHQFDNTPEYGVERIIERRYYIRKPRSVPKRDQITSTSDLIETQRKYRQHSSVSNASEHHRSCSQCSSRATPTFVEDFREQSDTLRHEITYLKNEIELLQKSQREFFQKLQNHFDIKTTPTNKQQQQQFNPPAISPPQSSSTETVSELPVRLTTKSKSRSMSTESQVSSASSIASTIKQPVKPPSSNASTITQFTATKNPSIPQAPTLNSKASSVISTPSKSTSITEFSTTIRNQPSISKSSPPITELSVTTIPQAPPLNLKPQISPLQSESSSPISGHMPSNPSTPLTQDIVTSKPPSIPQTLLLESVASVKSTVAHSRTPSIISRTASSITPAFVHAPIYEKELVHQRVISPRSQMIASSSYILESLSESSSSSSSTSSSGSNSPELHPPRIQQPPSTSLLDSELKDLVHYSSHLEITGFPASKPKFQPISSIPLDQYITQVASTTLNQRRQLDKYDLEIKPREILTSSAPLLMPPLDILP